MWRKSDNCRERQGDERRILPIPAPDRGCGMSRPAELALACVLAALLLPAMALIALAILVLDGRPVLYLAPRVRAPGQGFRLLKFRTMAPGSCGGVTGADKAARITALGRLLRRTRLDELPQIVNVLRGDMGFVGPRPPLAEYVAAAPELYARVLRTRPGITGLATLAFHAREEAILAAAGSAAETDRLYRRRCIPRKARIDLIYARRRSLALDLWLMALTAARVLGPVRGRLPRRRGRAAIFWTYCRPHSGPVANGIGAQPTRYTRTSTLFVRTVPTMSWCWPVIMSTRWITARCSRRTRRIRLI